MIRSIISAMFIISGMVFAQEARQQLEFEVASIKPSGPQSVRGSAGGPGSKDPVLYRFGVTSLLDLIATAWGVDYFQVLSPTPLDRQNFDLVAKVPDVRHYSVRS
jgi:uncharacterized protein (TIGR03435 family)